MYVGLQTSVKTRTSCLALKGQELNGRAVSLWYKMLGPDTLALSNLGSNIIWM